MPTKRNVERAAWNNMRHRCHNPKHRDYPNYGKRGIHVHPDWLDSKTGFDSFINYIGLKPEPHLTLERIDNDKGYIPGNVQWADRSTQARNRRKFSNQRIGWTVTHNGKTQTLGDWSRELGISYNCLRARYLSGKTPEQILSKGRLPRGTSMSNRPVQFKPV